VNPRPIEAMPISASDPLIPLAISNSPQTVITFLVGFYLAARNADEV